ncbi:hypothetical protein NCW_05720 [Burkholderia pseudomallei]
MRPFERASSAFTRRCKRIRRRVNTNVYAAYTANVTKMIAVKPPPYLPITTTSTAPISSTVGTIVNTAMPSR